VPISPSAIGVALAVSLELTSACVDELAPAHAAATPSAASRNAEETERRTGSFMQTSRAA
jgi:hypothetical protein